MVKQVGSLRFRWPTKKTKQGEGHTYMGCAALEKILGDVKLFLFFYLLSRCCLCYYVFLSVSFLSSTYMVREGIDQFTTLQEQVISFLFSSFPFGTTYIFSLYTYKERKSCFCTLKLLRKMHIVIVYRLILAVILIFALQLKIILSIARAS